MFDAECPHCHESVEIDGEDLPTNACDTNDGSCPLCDSPVVFGWYATATMEKDIKTYRNPD